MFTLLGNRMKTPKVQIQSNIQPLTKTKPDGRNKKREAKAKQGECPTRRTGEQDKHTNWT